MKEIVFKILTIENLDDILFLTKLLNPTLSRAELKSRQSMMFEFDNYNCFGFFQKDRLIGVSSGWMSVRLYSGKQLEIDNVIIDSAVQSKGYGKVFMSKIEAWAKTHNCMSIELNTYLQNDGSHKFYFNQGFRILGFHFQKQL